jgi:nucleotide-binding universal stress UspA family protein
MSGIVVGVDGSGHSRRALAWALEEAQRRHGQLTVLAVLPSPVRPATGIYWGLHEYPQSSSDTELMRTQVWEYADKVAHETGTTDVDMDVTVVTGDPAAELIAASRDASLVVVGSRSSTPVGQLLMGSVSGKVAHHAACPVVVIPAGDGS